MKKSPPVGDMRAAMRSLAVFAGLAAACLAVSLFTPVRDWLTTDRVARTAADLGPLLPLALLAAGVLTPLLFLPRWPIAFAAGLAYGVVRGALFATVVSALGAWLHFALARTLLSPAAERVGRRFGFRAGGIPPAKSFLLLVLLRAFPLSSFVATNLLAGAIRMRASLFLAASLLGMIPSSLMYAAWGKLMKRPEPAYYWLAGGLLVVSAAGTWLAARRVRPWAAALGGGRDAEGERHAD